MPITRAQYLARVKARVDALWDALPVNEKLLVSEKDVPSMDSAKLLTSFTSYVAPKLSKVLPLK